MKKKSKQSISDDGTKIYHPIGKRFSVGEDLADIPFGEGEDMPVTDRESERLTQI